MLGLFGMIAVLLALICLNSYWIFWEMQHKEHRSSFLTTVATDFFDLFGRCCMAVQNARLRSVARNMSMQKIVLRVIRWMAVDAFLGATFGGLYGLMFGGFGAMIHGEAWKLASIAGYFAVCGAVAGALVGACRAIFHSDEKASEPTDRLNEGTDDKQTPVAADRQRMTPSQRQPQNSLVAISSYDRPRMLGSATKHPLSC